MDNSNFVHEPMRINNSPMSEHSVRAALAIFHSAVRSSKGPISLENGYDEGSSLCIVSSEEGAGWHINNSITDDVSVSDAGKILFNYATPEDIQYAYHTNKKDYMSRLSVSVTIMAEDIETISRLRLHLDYYKNKYKK